MTEKQKAEEETDNEAETDESKWDVDASLKSGVDASVTLVSGMAKAMAEGLNSFGEAVTKDNALQRDWSNGFVKGFVEGSCAALEKTSKALRDAYDCVIEEEREGCTAS